MRVMHDRLHPAALAKPLVPLAVLLDALEDLLSWEGGGRLRRLGRFLLFVLERRASRL